MLSNCAANGDFEAVKYLIKSGVNVHSNDDVALRMSAEHGHFEIFKYLIDRGANLYVHNNYVLSMSIRNGHFKIVSFIMEIEMSNAMREAECHGLLRRNKRKRDDTNDAFSMSVNVKQCGGNR